MNISIVRTFVALRKMAFHYSGIMQALEEIRSKVSGHDQQIDLIYEYLGQLQAAKHEELKYKNRKQIGFKTGEK